jgi:transposase InsO family protein
MPWEEKTPMEERTKFIEQATLPDANITELCVAFGVSRKTGYKWLQRAREEGLRGFHERSRRPRWHKNMLEEKVVCELVALKRAHPTWGPKKIHVLYVRQHGPGGAVSLSSVKRVLLRSGLVERQQRHRVVPISGGAPVLKAEAANDIWSIDFKGWWQVKGRRRCNPLTVRDVYSRYLLCVEHLEHCSFKEVKEIFCKLFKRYGKPLMIHSDNGQPFRSAKSLHSLSQLSAWLVAQGIALSRSRPSCPQDNGAHERMHRDIAAEIEREGKGSQAELEMWRCEFNEERPHEALGMRTPSKFYKKSPRVYREIKSLVYAGMASRRVSHAGMISVEGKPLFLSTALRGWDVGLKRQKRWGNIEVWFGHLHLGDIEKNSASFKAGAPALKLALPEELPKTGGVTTSKV